MKRLIALLGVILLLSACGPSAEMVAAQVASTMTAVAQSWTATPTNTPEPTNTPTPTPIPYSAAVYVVDENSLPLQGASITLSGGDDYQNSQLTDSQGAALWDNLPDSSLVINCTSQGYKTVELEASIERGENRFELGLERDPFGLLPGEILADGEALLFIEDFQDNNDEFVDQDGGWEIIEDPAEPGNFVYKISPNSAEGDFSYLNFYNESPVDFVFSYRVKYVDLRTSTDNNWIWLVFRSGYALSFSPYWTTIDLIDFSGDEWVWLRQSDVNFRSDTWYEVRVEAIGSDVRYYVNGSLAGAVRDIREPEGSQGLSFSIGQDATVLFDDLVVRKPAE